MTANADWRPISADEARIVADVVAGSGKTEYRHILEDVGVAEVSHEAEWVLDVRTRRSAAAIEAQNGPLPVRAYVMSQGEFHGEIMLWIKDGHLSGIEYAWVTDEPPTRWPIAAELQIVPS